jgi:hypothetical protein
MRICHVNDVPEARGLRCRHTSSKVPDELLHPRRRGKSQRALSILQAALLRFEYGLSLKSPCVGSLVPCVAMLRRWWDP